LSPTRAFNIFFLVTSWFSARVSSATCSCCIQCSDQSHYDHPVCYQVVVKQADYWNTSFGGGGAFLCLSHTKFRTQTQRTFELWTDGCLLNRFHCEVRTLCRYGLIKGCLRVKLHRQTFPLGSLHRCLIVFDQVGS
jgi:hypothetical protein